MAADEGGPKQSGSSSKQATGTLRPLWETDLGDDIAWSLIEAAPDCLVMVDERGRILLVNSQTESMFGYERAELLGKNVEVLLPERFRSVHTAHRTRYRAEPRPRAMGAGLELAARRKDGTEFPVEISLSPLNGPNGVRVLATVRDISDRIRTEAEVNDIRRILNATHEAVFIFDADSLQYIYVNQGAVEQLDYSADELLTMTPLHVKPELTEAQLRGMIAALESGTSRAHTYTTIHRRKDGVDVPVEVVMQVPEPSPDGRRRVVSMARDISERLQAQELLKDAEREVAQLADRDRIARELHDKVIQRLFAAGMTLQSVQGQIREPVAAERVASVVDGLDETIRDVRSAIFDLQPKRPGRSVRSEVMGVVTEESNAFGFEPRVHFNGPIDTMPDDIANEMLPTLREALSNAARHAQATSVQVIITAGDDVTLRVVDNGVGMPTAVGGSGNGLRNMRVRAEKLGGDCHIEAGPSGGTALVWQAPTSERARADV